jgi:VIT1/CCC1 family predicted Fe2+/Mn2+ transporter
VAGSRSGAFRAAIFGVNDGLVSNLALIMGMAGAGVDRDVVLVAGIAGLLAGAFSMAAGEYASMRVQRELFERLLHIEAHEIGTDPEGETAELARLLER